MLPTFATTHRCPLESPGAPHSFRAALFNAPILSADRMAEPRLTSRTDAGGRTARGLGSFPSCHLLLNSSLFQCSQERCRASRNGRIRDAVQVTLESYSFSKEEGPDLAVTRCRGLGPEAGRGLLRLESDLFHLRRNSRGPGPYSSRRRRRELRGQSGSRLEARFTAAFFNAKR